MSMVSLYDEPYWTWLGPLAAFLDDSEVTCLIADGSENLFVERRFCLERVPGQLPPEALERLIDRLASAAGASSEQALVTLNLARGETAALVRGPITAGAPHLVIQRCSARPLRLEDLIDADVVPHVVARVLSAVVAGRRGILVAGPSAHTAAHLLAGLCSQIEQGERLVVLDPVAPLRFEHPLRIPLRPAGPAPAQHCESFTAAALLRPDRVLASGLEGADGRCFVEVAIRHPGSMGAVVGADARSALSSLESMIIGDGVSPEAARALCLFVTTLAADTDAAVPVLVPTGRVPGFLPALAPFGVSLDAGHFSSQQHGLPTPGPPSLVKAIHQAPSEAATPEPAPAPVPQSTQSAPREPSPPPWRVEPMSIQPPPPAADLTQLSESDDPGWEVEVMPLPEPTAQIEPPVPAPPPTEDAFTALLSAKRASAAALQEGPQHVPQPPLMHPQMQGFQLEPPPQPAGWLDQEEESGGDEIDIDPVSESEPESD